MATKPPAAKSTAKPTRLTQTGKASPPAAIAVPKLIRDLALQMLGTDRGVEAWLTMPNPELGGRTPTELIATGQADVVENFIQANLHGNFG